MIRFSARRSTFALHNGSRSVHWHQLELAGKFVEKVHYVLLLGTGLEY